nr:PREDICTED: ankyrin repeat, SAM and basic leucine zipper domain-containing protein 1 [Bemisia tabaci]
MADNGGFEDSVTSFMLTDAIKTGSLDRVTQILAEHQININDKIDGSFTPFLLACSYCQFDLMVHFLNHGADPMYHHHFFNALMATCSSSCSDEELVLRCVRLLINQGLLINEVDPDRTTPLMYAAKSGHIEAVKELLMRGASIDSIDHEGWSAIFFAVSQKHTDIVKLLIESGASVKLEDRRGRKVLEIAETKGLQDIADLILEAEGEKKIEEEWEQPVQLTVQSYSDMVRELPEHNEFMADALSFLHNLCLSRYSRPFHNNKVSLGKLLLMDEGDLKENGVYLSSHRQLILSSVKKFHLSMWKNCLGVKRGQKLESDEFAFFLANITRHLYVLAQSAKYIKKECNKKGNRVFDDELRPIILKNVEQLVFIEKKLEQFRNLGSTLQKYDEVKYVDLIDENTLSIKNRVLSKIFMFYVPSIILTFYLLRQKHVVPVCLTFFLNNLVRLKSLKFW